jgi:hypothetical protein
MESTMIPLLPLLGLAALVVLAVVIVTIPMLLPWPQRARWLIAAQTIDTLGVGPATPQLREVVITMTARRDGECEIDLAAPGSRQGRTTLVGTSLQRADIAALHGWCAAAVPVLMHAGGDGQVSLHGPSGSVVGLVVLPLSLRM